MIHRRLAPALLLLVAISASAIDISFVSALGEPMIPDSIPGLRTNRPGFAHVAWIGKHKLVYTRAPLYWEVDTSDLSFRRMEEIEKRINTVNSMLVGVAGQDAAVVRYGSLFEPRFAVYSESAGWHSIDQPRYDSLRSQPFLGQTTVAAGTFNDWEYRLLGDHAIVPRPVFDPDNLGFSLRSADSGVLVQLPKEFAEFRSNGSPALVAVSFDRFRVAVVGQIVRREANGPYELGWPLYLLKVTYEGSVQSTLTLRSKPCGCASTAGELTLGTEVHVADAANYEVDHSHREDFWYRVDAGDKSGWVFGGDLLIEGQTWSERLELRGKPLDLEAALGTP